MLPYSFYLTLSQAILYYHKLPEVSSNNVSYLNLLELLSDYPIDSDCNLSHHAWKYMLSNSKSPIWNKTSQQIENFETSGRKLIMKVPAL